MDSATNTTAIAHEGSPPPHGIQPGTRGELYLCLARALQVPRDRELIPALRNDLGTDLAAIATELGLSGSGEPIAELQRHLAALGDDPLPLLQAYSALFLTPPQRAPLNAGIYLDGASMGPATLELERCYYHYGVDRSETFSGMPDHLVLLLEFVALLHFRALEAQNEGDDATATQRITEAGRFLQRYVAPWSRDWVQRMDAADVAFAHAGIYRQLGRVLDLAVRDEVQRLLQGVEDDAPQPDPVSQDTKTTGTAVDHDTVEPATCRNCGQAMELQGDLAVIHRRLTAAGLAADHVAICPDCRGSSGMQPMKPVRVPGQRR